MKAKTPKELFSKDVQKALARLSRTDDFKIIEGFIEGCRDSKALMSCMVLDDTSCKRMQGEVKFADYLLVKIAEAPDLVRNT